VTLTLDSTEQGLDIILETLTLACLVPDEDAAVIRWAAARRCYIILLVSE
jgi:hypothetical protein